MKRTVISAILTLCLTFSLGGTAFGVDYTLHFNFILESAGSRSQQIKVEPGEEFVVNSVIKCTSIAANETYQLHAMQVEIVYDKDMLELVSAVYNAEFISNAIEIATRDFTSREGNFQRVMINDERDAMGEKPADLVVATLTFRAIADGVTSITNENAKMVIASGRDVYSSEVTDVTVKIGGGTTDPMTHAISVTNPTGGTITTAPSGSAKAGTTVSLGITLDNGYTLSQWVVRGVNEDLIYNGAVVSGAGFVMPDQSVTVTATLNYSSGGGIGGPGGSAGAPAQEITIDKTDTPLTGARIARFNDVPENHWAFSYIEYLVELGFVKGKTEVLYYPSDNITRGEFVTILARMSGEATAGGSTPFRDVAADAFYAGAVAWGYENGIVKGTSETTFSPNDKVSRQDIAVMLVRYAGYRGFRFGAVNEAKDFTDKGEIAGYAVESVYSMQKANVIGGYEDGSFKPRGNATRAEAAKMLALMHNGMFPDLIIE